MHSRPSVQIFGQAECAKRANSPTSDQDNASGEVFSSARMRPRTTRRRLEEHPVHEAATTVSIDRLRKPKSANAL
eukprot:883009-Pyramimonas_sp.AAC.1